MHRNNLLQYFKSCTPLEKMAWSTAFFVLLVQFLPYFLLGTNAYVRIHDTLEGEWIWLHILNETNTAWDFEKDTVIPQVMNGLIRSAFPTGLSVQMVLLTIFGTFWGYVINKFFVLLIGFVGMYLLLKDYFIKNQNFKYIVILCAALFMALPYFPVFGISITGQPLILWAFMNLRKNIKTTLSFVITLLYPFYSSIVWIAIPGLLALGLILIYEFIKYRRIPYLYILGMIGMATMYILVNYEMFESTMVDDAFVSHRTAYDLYKYQQPSLQSSIVETLQFLGALHYHIATFVAIPILLALILSLQVKNYRKRPQTMLIIILVICVFQGFYNLIEFSLGDRFSFLSAFRLNRFSSILPLLWILAFALSLAALWDKLKFRGFILPIFFVQLFVGLFGNDEVLNNYKIMLNKGKFPSYDAYLSPDQFNEIANYISEPFENYRVASLGLSPTVAQYNGFYTLDGLQSLYDYNYKQKFRLIFAKEIEKSQEIEAYFDGWGNRCYIFSSELGTHYPAYYVSKRDSISLKNFEFNAQAFADLGGKYLISAVEIENAEKVNLHLEKVFESNKAWRTIYLYKNLLLKQ